VPKDDDIADDLISGSLKRSPSYHTAYGKKTYKELRILASGRRSDLKARRMKKLMEDAARLREKGKGRRS